MRGFMVILAVSLQASVASHINDYDAAIDFNEYDNFDLTTAYTWLLLLSFSFAAGGNAREHGYLPSLIDEITLCSELSFFLGACYSTLVTCF